MSFRTFLTTSASALAMLTSAGAALAQSTGSQEFEEIVVTSRRLSENLAGLINAEQIAKSRSTISQEYLETQTSGQTIIQSINLLPGVNFTNSDPYGSSGGNLRLRSFDGPRISLTADGMPLNDTGNYSIYSNQIFDPELIEKVSVNLGTTDVDSPTASATGGTVSFTTRKPSEKAGVVSNTSVGSFDYRRQFVMADTGRIGNTGLSAYLAASYQYYDKYKGPGSLTKKQANFKIYDDLGDGDFISLAGHYNVNRNNFYRNPTAADVAANGYDFDNTKTCALTTRGAGTVQNDGSGSSALESAPAGCTNFYKLKINPSNTGNLRAQSRISITEDLIVTVDPWYQYTLANGGGTTVVAETDGRLRGKNNAAGADLNGDGDTLDSIRLYTPNTTNTNRFGVTASLIYKFEENQAIRAAYTLDYGRHRQTGQFTPVLADGSPSNIWAGLRGPTVKAADNADLRGRDRFSIAKLNQISGSYDGSFFDRMLTISAGVRAPFFVRDLNQYCYTQISNSNQYCTTETPTATLADGTVTFASSGATNYKTPYTGTKKFDKVLPNVGLSFRPFGEEHQFFISYSEGLSVPRTDNLYSVEILTVQPETNKAYELGYRYQTKMVLGSISVWKSDFNNRIVSSYDPDTRLSVDRNVGPVKIWGVDGEVGVTPVEGLSLYASASYNHSEVKNNIPYNATVVIPTAGKKLVETPDWTVGGRIEYKTGPFTFGVQAKYVGDRFATDVNDEVAPSYTTVDANVQYALDDLGVNGAYIQLNATNLFDKKYFGSIGTSRFSSDPTKPYGTALPAYAIGAPQTFQATLHLQF